MFISFFWIFQNIFFSIYTKCIVILLWLIFYFVKHFSDKKPAAMQHGENSVAPNPSMPINALEFANQVVSNKSTELFSTGNHPSLHHLASSSSDTVHIYIYNSCATFTQAFVLIKIMVHHILSATTHMHITIYR